MGIPLEVLNNFRRFVGTTFDKTGDIQKPTLVYTDDGGTTSTWTTVEEKITFSVSEGFGGMGQLEQKYTERIGTRTPYFLTFPRGLDIDEAYRVEETAPEIRDFEIIGLLNWQVSNQADIRAVAVEIG